MSRLGVTEDLTSVEWRDTNWLEVKKKSRNIIFYLHIHNKYFIFLKKKACWWFS
jgi:hypothetical protein